MSYPLMELFQFSNLLQIPNDHRMAYAEFFGNFSCSCKRISFSDHSQLVVVTFQRLATALLIFKALLSFAKLLEPLAHCMFISSSWTKCGVDAANYLCCFTTKPFGIQIRKLLEFAFCLTSFPQSKINIK